MDGVMEASTAAASFDPSAWLVPVDFKIKKSTLGFSGDDLTVYDARGDLAFRINHWRRDGSAKTLFDAAGNPLITVVYQDDEWQGFRWNSRERRDLIFTVQKLIYSPFQIELDVFISDRSVFDPKPSFRLRGNPFQRSCTIVRGNSIVAQTSLLYKLKKIFHSKRKFQLTVYPGNDPILIIAMLTAFYWT